MAVHREDLRLIEDGKSWVLIAALIKRSVKSIKEHAS
jgi:DNA-binding NarL/FixJ family response regulator